MPIWGSRRHVLTSKVVVLMARAAFHWVRPVPIRTAANVHGMRMIVVTLPGKVSARVAIHAARVTQNGKDGPKGCCRSVSITNQTDFFTALALRNSGTRNLEEFVPIR
jgi:hypothetical protein